MPVSIEELRKQLKLMPSGKALDSKGVVEELLKHGGDVFLQLVADVLTELWNLMRKYHESGDSPDSKFFSKKEAPR
eukprot:12426872-Karenia_brevis.AAC.1